MDTRLPTPSQSRYWNFATRLSPQVSCGCFHPSDRERLTIEHSFQREQGGRA
jgi:hypothetical protein